MKKLFIFTFLTLCTIQISSKVCAMANNYAHLQAADARVNNPGYPFYDPRVDIFQQVNNPGQPNHRRTALDLARAFLNSFSAEDALRDLLENAHNVVILLDQLVRRAAGT
jgi:hypothetical protein